MRAADLASMVGETARGGRVKVLPTLQLDHAPTTFVIGDMGYLEEGGRPLPQVAQVAIQQGELAAKNILRHLRGEPLETFKYNDKGNLATIGKSAAVAQIGPWKFTGFFAWLVWLLVHLVQLIGFRNRLMVLLNWGWNYLIGERGVRLITEDERREPAVSELKLR